MQAWVDMYYSLVDHNDNGSRGRDAYEISISDLPETFLVSIQCSLHQAGLHQLRESLIMVSRGMRDNG